MFWNAIGGALLILAGIVFFLKPEWVWELTEQWKSYRANEPSDFYCITTKIGGVVLILVGIVIEALIILLPFLPD
jgi:hypothetical protein